MRHSIWKLTALVGISGLGFLVLLQVQKSLHNTATAEAAELAPGDLAKSDKPTASRKHVSAPGRVRLSETMSSTVDQQTPPAARVEHDGLDFRQRLPQQSQTQSASSRLQRTAEVQLQPVPQRKNEPKPIISPASFESATAKKATDLDKKVDANAKASQPLEDLQPVPQAEPQLLAADDEFGPDPFGDLDAFFPKEDTSGLQEPTPAEPPATPAELLEQDDPFATFPEEIPAKDEAPAEPVGPSSTVESASEEWLDEAPATSDKKPEAADVPTEGAANDAATPVEPIPAEPPLEPSPEPSPTEEPLPPPQNPENEALADPLSESAEPTPAEADPFDFDFGDPSDDPFGSAPTPAEPLDPELTPAVPEDAEIPETPLEPMPEPSVEVPATEPQAAPELAPEPDPAPAQDPLSPMESDLGDFPPASEAPSASPPAEMPQPNIEPAPAVDPFGSSPGNDERPGLLPADEPPIENGADTVSPDAPRGPQHARLTVEKKAPPRAVLGEPLVYEIIVTNVGDSPAHEVTISDVVPRGADLQGTIPRAEMTGRTLVWKYESLEPQQSQTIKIKVVPKEAGSIGSVATVNFVSEVAATTEVIAPRLSLKVTAPPKVSLGEPVDIRFEISNQGSAPAEKVLLRNILPEGFQHSDGRDLEYEVGTLAPGETDTVVLRVATTKAGQFENSATLTAAGGLKTETNATVAVEAQALSVTRQGPVRRYVGRPAMFANVVKNASDRTARNVAVIEQVPSGMNFVEASHGGKFDPATRQVTWQLEAVQPAQEIALQVVLTATTEGEQDSLVRVEEAGSSSIELTSSTTVQGLPSLAPTMQGAEKPIIVGERTAFRIRLRNRGSAAAEGVEIALSLPSQAKFVEATGGEASTDPSGVTTVKVDAPIPPNEEKLVEMVVEGANPGTARFRTSVKASHMPEPLVRDEELIVLAPKQ